MEIKIPKEVRQHSETIFFGLSTRQFICAVLAVSVAIGTYFLTKGAIGKETASWVCIVAAAPLAAAGFFRYNGLTFEQFVWAFIKSQILCAGPRVFRSENLYCKLPQTEVSASGSESLAASSNPSPSKRSIGTASGKPAASSAAHGASQTSTMHWPPMRIREICLRPIAAH